MLARMATVLSRQAKTRQARAESRERIVGAATELLRRRGYAELTVDEVMREAGLARTIFYRHFGDLGELLRQASRQAIEDLLTAQRELERVRPGGDEATLHSALRNAAEVYREHGPMMRAQVEAAAVDPDLAAYQDEMRERYNAFAADALRKLLPAGSERPHDVDETARALNLLAEGYLLDAFGREPRVSVDVAARTLSEIWDAVLGR
jgi:AcrR family transcriptional regulator